MRKLAILIVTALGCSTVAEAIAAPLNFAGVSGRSNTAAVQARFPAAKTARLCRAGEQSRQFADGISRCEYLKVPSYKIAGFDFELAIFFNEGGTVKTIALRWPSIADEGARPTAREIENAYSALIDQFVSKYGRYVEKPPCSYIGGRCTEWQMDGMTDWHAGGERIVMEYETEEGAFRGVSIKYSFADTSSFNQF